MKKAERKKNKLCLYLTAGYPSLTDTIEIVKALDHCGVDYIEIGMPYSDPLADGKVIQETSRKALENGMTLGIYFEQLASIKDQITTPLLYMGYLNPLLKMGIDRFLECCKKAGISGCIIPDLPIDIYRDEYETHFKQAGIGMNFLISPSTSDERIRLADELSDQYLYVISQNTITGTPDRENDMRKSFYRQIAEKQIRSEYLIGFGIKDRKDFELACLHADGAIIGSAFLEFLNQDGSISENVSNFIKIIRD